MNTFTKKSLVIFLAIAQLASVTIIFPAVQPSRTKRKETTTDTLISWAINNEKKHEQHIRALNHKHDKIEAEHNQRIANMEAERNQLIANNASLKRTRVIATLTSIAITGLVLNQTAIRESITKQTLNVYVIILRCIGNALNPSKE